MGAISVSNESKWKRARLIPVVGIKGDRWTYPESVDG